MISSYARPRWWPPSTLLLLILAFFGICVTLAVTGLMIKGEATKVESATFDIMENGFPSILSAHHIRELGVRLHWSLAREFDGQPRPAPDDVPSLLRQYREAVHKDELDPVHFPPELPLLRVLYDELQQLTLDYEHATAEYGTSKLKMPKYRQEALTSLLNSLDIARKRWQEVNEDGMYHGQRELAKVAKRLQLTLVLAFAFSILVSVTLALLLSRAIAVPLRNLISGIKTLPELPEFETLLPADKLAPHEIHDLAAAFIESALELKARHEELEAAKWTLARTNQSLDELVKSKTTALESTNVRLTEVIEELDRRSRSRSTFIATISHELRGPLTVIKGAVSTLANHGSEIPTHVSSKLLADVSVEAEHLSEIINDLLDAARLEAGTFRIVPEADVNLAELAISMARKLSAVTGRQIDVSSKPDLPTVVADPQRICQILRNLLDNACRHSETGPIEVTVACVPPIEPEQPPRLEVSVTDRGLPIPKSAWPDLFMPFGGPRSSSPASYGLGLAIAKQLVEAHGGQIGLADGSKGCNTFWFWLPVGEFERSTDPYLLGDGEFNRGAADATL